MKTERSFQPEFNGENLLWLTKNLQRENLLSSIKTWASAVDVEPEELTTTNADGIPVIVPTQKTEVRF